jgi:hypothetical protein
MNRTRWRLMVACLAILGAAIAVAGGSAGNRTAATPFKFLPGDSFTYGEQFATETKIMNTGSSMFTQLEVHHLIPVTAGANPVPVALLGSSCGAVVVGNEAVCKFDQLSSKSTLTVTFLWQAPTSGVAVTTNGYWSIKEGKPTNINERFDFEGGPFSASLLGNDPTTERKRAAGYETAGAAICNAGSGNLHTNPALTKAEPVSSTLCLPPEFTIPSGSSALGYSAAITEVATKPASGSHKELGQSIVCVAELGQACVVGHTPVNWGLLRATQIFRILQDGMTGPKQISEVFHNGVKLPPCAGPNADPDFAEGCVLEITPPPSGVSPEVWTVVAVAPTNGPWNW